MFRLILQAGFLDHHQEAFTTAKAMLTDLCLMLRDTTIYKTMGEQLGVMWGPGEGAEQSLGA